MIRPRKTGYRDLPPNLYFHKGSGKYCYHRPDDKSQHYVGTDRQVAIDTANLANSQLIPKTDKIDAILGNIMTMEKWCDHFENVILPLKKLAPKTIREYKNQLKRIRAYFKNDDIGTIPLTKISDFLDTFPPVLSNRVRSLLITLFKYAKSKGHCESNIVLDTIPKEAEKMRGRLTMEGFKLIYNHPETEQWFKNALDAAMQTTFRENEISLMEFEMNIEEIIEGALTEVLRVVHQKNEFRARIRMFPKLKELINRCRDDIASPYIIHRMPKRIGPRHKMAKHYTFCSPDLISKTFTKIRDKIPYFQAMKPEERPTFHEIRSLALSTYKKQGQNPQFLAGHNNEEMTDYYIKGHDNWIDVKVSGIDY